MDVVSIVIINIFILKSVISSANKQMVRNFVRRERLIEAEAEVTSTGAAAGTAGADHDVFMQRHGMNRQNSNKEGYLARVRKLTSKRHKAQLLFQLNSANKIL